MGYKLIYLCIAYGKNYTSLGLYVFLNMCTVLSPCGFIATVGRIRFVIGLRSPNKRIGVYFAWSAVTPSACRGISAHQAQRHYKALCCMYICIKPVLTLKSLPNSPNRVPMLVSRPLLPQSNIYSFAFVQLLCSYKQLVVPWLGLTTLTRLSLPERSQRGSILDARPLTPRPTDLPRRANPSAHLFCKLHDGICSVYLPDEERTRRSMERYSY